MNDSPTNCACCIAPGREDIQGLLCRSIDSLFALPAQTCDGPVLFGQKSDEHHFDLGFGHSDLLWSW